MIAVKYIAYCIIVLFFCMDFILRKGKTAIKIAGTKTDNNSTVYLIFCFFAILVIADILAEKQVGIFASLFLFVFALLMMLTGIIIRIISMKTLSEAYTRTLTTKSGQRLITTGIYKYLRHPGYLGTLLIWSFFGVATGNYLVPLIAFALLIATYAYRIKNEEKMLFEIFPDEYLEYAKTSKRIIPFVY